MAKKDTELFTAELFNSLFAGRDPKTLPDSGGLIGGAKRHWPSTCSMRRWTTRPKPGYHRNGSNAKTTLTSEGRMQLSIPPDVHGRFDPALSDKYRHRVPDFDDTVNTVSSGTSVHPRLCAKVVRY